MVGERGGLGKYGLVVRDGRHIDRHRGAVVGPFFEVDDGGAGGEVAEALAPAIEQNDNEG